MNNKSVYRKALYDTNLSIKARFLMVFLVQLNEEIEKEDMEVSVSFLCKALNYSNKTVVRAIQELEDNGYINKTRRGKKGNIYNIVREER